MSQEFDAVFERGVFRPLEQVDLPERSKVHLRIQEAAADTPVLSADTDSTQAAALRDLLDWVHSCPESVTGETVSARDHDRALYGCRTAKGSKR
jgi:predicted DNA-binding antitoxin AbrB/MazE fold protein